MDVSPEYIKQCEKANKIQQLAEASNRVHWGYHFAGEVMLVEGGRYYWRNVWLPTQGELQKMLLNDERDFVDLLSDFHWHWTAYKTDEKYPWREYIEGRDEEKIRKDFTSMEQLWLAFVMKTNWNKEWNGNDWTEATNTK